MPMHVSAGKIKKLWRTDDDAVLHEAKNLWTDQGQVFSSGPTIEVHDVTVGDLVGNNTFHPLLVLTPPAGQTWHIQIEGTFSAGFMYPSSRDRPTLTIGSNSSTRWDQNQSATFSGEITSTSPNVGVTTHDSFTMAALTFTGTVTVTKP